MAELKKRSITADDIRYLYFGNKPVSKETLNHYADYITDVIFYRAIHETANIQMQMGHSSTYMYKFSYDNRASLIKQMLNITDPGIVTHSFKFVFLIPKQQKRVYII